MVVRNPTGSILCSGTETCYGKLYRTAKVESILDTFKFLFERFSMKL